MWSSSQQYKITRKLLELVSNKVVAEWVCEQKYPTCIIFLAISKHLYSKAVLSDDKYYVNSLYGSIVYSCPSDCVILLSINEVK